jgi:hypothetical protein
VVGQLPEVADRNAVAPTDARQLIRPAGRVEAAVQVVEVSLRNVDVERVDLGHGGNARTQW